MSPFASGDESRLLLPSIYDLFKSHVPATDTGTKSNFSVIESLLFTFHQLGSKAPGAVSSLCGIAPVYTGQPSDMVSLDGSEAKLKDLNARLQLLASKSEVYVKELHEALKALSGDLEKRNTANAALQTTKNIQDLVKSLLKTKPVLLGNRTGIKLSWQKDNKRKNPESIPPIPSIPFIPPSNGAKKMKGFQGVYTPPAKREGAPVVSRGGRGFRGSNRGTNRGTFRGRGRGRFWK